MTFAPQHRTKLVRGIIRYEEQFTWGGGPFTLNHYVLRG